MSAKLVVLSGALCGEALALNAPQTAIGRDPDNHLSIADQLLSRRHCTVEATADGFLVRDLGSANGTYVNGTAINDCLLQHGDRIRAGNSLLLFVDKESEDDDGVCAADVNDALTERIVRGDNQRGSNCASDLSGIVVTAFRQRHGLIGDAPAMRAVYEWIDRVARADCTVLICGETGTGKELAARAIHDTSNRGRGPFIAINCAALTETLLESELFGHEKGAFTGAVGLKKGKLELADRGTLFLDEIGDLAPGLQAKLLRALQHHEFERVGGTRTIHVDVRVIAATNIDLEKGVAEGRFRQDLWYRLNVVNVTMPPLRARRADISSLVVHFGKRYGHGRPLEISPAAMHALSAYEWPGNVRELENVIERATVLGRSNRIEVDDLPQGVRDSAGPLPEPGALYHRNVVETKRRLILDAIDQSGGNHTAAARLLGINPTYLHRLLRNLQIRDAVSRQ
jgi:transcriptional regulator with GAF, ATPase, and Fis domain